MLTDTQLTGTVRHSRAVYFVGIDLAWGQRKPTGVAAVDAAGKLVFVGAATDDASIRGALAPFVQDDCLVAIDAPLIVTNPTGQRPAEKQLNADFGRFQAGAHPANMGKPEFAETPRGARIAASLDLDIDPHSKASRRAIEVYPHPATVALFRLGRTLKYKAKPGRGVPQLRSELLRLMEHVEGLASAVPPLRVADDASWAQLRDVVEKAERKSELRHAEDPVDAVVCAYVAMYAAYRSDDVTIYGDFETGYIVTPTLPHDLAPAPPESTPGAVHDAIATYSARRPALQEATKRYLAQVTDLLDDAGINYLSVTGRTKSVASFAAKADRNVDGRRLFTDPLSEITDQVGLRVITYLRDDVAAVANLLGEEMRLLDDRDMGLETASEGRWGYASRHLLVATEGEQQPASIQVRTILQHAWAEFEHEHPLQGFDLRGGCTRPGPALHTGGGPTRARRPGVLGDPGTAAVLRACAADTRDGHRPQDSDAGAGDLPRQSLSRRGLVAHRALRLDLGPAAGAGHRLARRSGGRARRDRRRRRQRRDGIPLPGRRGAPARRSAAGRVRDALSATRRQLTSKSVVGQQASEDQHHLDQTCAAGCS